MPFSILTLLPFHQCLECFIYSNQQRLYLWVDFINKSRTVYDFQRFGFSRKKTRIFVINMMMAHSRAFSIICTSLFENINNYINFCLNDSIIDSLIHSQIHIIFDETSGNHGGSFHFSPTSKIRTLIPLQWFMNLFIKWILNELFFVDDKWLQNW